jgi:hypothetical protein
VARNANAERLTDLCNELASLKQRLLNAASEADDATATVLSASAETIGNIFANLWDTAGAFAKSPNSKEDEWARLLAVGAKPAVKGE